MYDHLTDFFVQLLKQSHSVDIAIAEFKRNLADDPELRAAYREWCQEQGTTERFGFKDFCEEYIDGTNDVWNTLTDYDDE